MKKRILKLSLMLTVFIGLLFTINIKAQANSECSHWNYDTTKVVTPATPDADGKEDWVCSNCHEVVYSYPIYKPSSITLSQTSATYTGGSFYVYPTVKDSRGYYVGDYDTTITNTKNNKTVTYPSEAGSYNVRIQFKGDYSGSVDRTFTIKPTTIKKSKLTIDAVKYNKGKAVKPKKINYSYYVLNYGKDYTIKKISNNKKYGKANVTLEFKGNYKGTVSTTFTIATDAVKKVNVKSRTNSNIKISWKKVKDATGYKVYTYNSKKDKFKEYKKTTSTSMEVKPSSKDDIYISGYIVAYKKVGKKNYESNKYYFADCIKPAKATYKVSSSKKGTIKVAPKKLSKNTSKEYEVQISTNKSFNKKGKVENVDKYFYNSGKYAIKSSEIAGLQSGKTYYVRCREYGYSYSNNKNGNYKKITGSWGNVIKVKVK